MQRHAPVIVSESGVRPQEEAVDSNTASERAYSADRQSLRQEASPFDRPPGEAGLRLSERASLIAVLLVSLGLWAAIWAAVAALVSPGQG